MKDKKGRSWKDHGLAPKRDFYLTEKEKRDGESGKIHRWLELADRLFNSDDSDPNRPPA